MFDQVDVALNVLSRNATGERRIEDMGRISKFAEFGLRFFFVGQVDLDRLCLCLEIRLASGQRDDIPSALVLKRGNNVAADHAESADDNCFFLGHGLMSPWMADRV